MRGDACRGSETRDRHDQEPCKDAAAGCTCQDDNDPSHGVNRTAICALTCSSAGSKHVCSPLMSPFNKCPSCCTDSYWNDTKACSICYGLECPFSELMCQTMTGTAKCQVHYLEYCVLNAGDLSIIPKSWGVLQACMDPQNFNALKNEIITASTTFGVAIPYALRFLVDFAWDWLWAGLLICCPCCCKRRNNQEEHQSLGQPLNAQDADAWAVVRRDPSMCTPKHVYEEEPPGFTCAPPVCCPVCFASQ